MMNVKYFCAPNLREVLPEAKPCLFDYLGESPEDFPPTIQTTYPGLAFDFNCGMRLQIPAGNWHVKILDGNSEVVCFDDDVSDVVLISPEKFFVRRRFLLWLDGKFVFDYLYDATNRRVHFYFYHAGMGDRIVLFPYMEAFRKKWNCRLSCTVDPYLQELINLYFPAIECMEPPSVSYATYFPAPSFSVPLRRSRDKLLSLTFALPRRLPRRLRRGSIQTAGLKSSLI